MPRRPLCIPEGRWEGESSDLTLSASGSESHKDGLGHGGTILLAVLGAAARIERDRRDEMMALQVN
jgi:hypothetical protein